MKHLPRCVLLLMLAAALCVPALSHWSSIDQDRDAIAAAASASHPAGTDELGRDRAVRLASAALLSLGSATVAAALCTALSLCAGVAAVFAPRPVPGLLLYSSDLFLMLPWLFLLLTVRSVLPLNVSAYTSAGVTSGLIALLGWPVTVRSLHSRVCALRGSDWMLQARAGGINRFSAARRHILPHLKPLYQTQFLLCVPAFLVAEANLGAIGLGVSAPLVSWGSLLGELSNTSAASAGHWVYLPLATLVAVLFTMEMLTSEESAK